MPLTWSKVIRYPNDVCTELPDGAGRVIAWLSRRVEAVLGELNVSLPQYRVLMLLERQPEGASVVADELAVTRPTVTAIIDGLVARHLVDRALDSTDRRRVRLLITADGQALLAKSDAAVEDSMAALLEKLGNTSDKKAALRGLALWREALTS